MREFTTLAYGSLVETTTPEARADLDALIDGRELPSVVRARQEKERERYRATTDLLEASRMKWS